MSHQRSWGEPRPLGGPGQSCTPGVGTYDADPGHEEQHGTQGQAHTIVAHSVEDRTEFLLAYASEHPAAGALMGRGERERGWGQGREHCIGQIRGSAAALEGGGW